MDRHYEVPNQSPKSWNDGKWSGWTVIDLRWGRVHSVPSLSKDAGSTNYFMML